jgi:hypothetical protein
MICVWKHISDTAKCEECDGHKQFYGHKCEYYYPTKTPKQLYELQDLMDWRENNRIRNYTYPN